MHVLLLIVETILILILLSLRRVPLQYEEKVISLSV